MKEFRHRPQLAQVKNWLEQEQRWDGRNHRQALIRIRGDRWHIWQRIAALVASAITLGVLCGLTATPVR